VFPALAIFIHSSRAFIFASIIFAALGFLSFQPITTEKAASVFIQNFLSFTQKSKVTKSQSLKTTSGRHLP
jgi:hypothetical protein